MNISAVVLAAGMSSRMHGRNKLLMPWAGKTVIAYAVENLMQARVQQVVVVLGFAADKIQAEIRESEVCFVMNQDYAQGMSTSIVAGVQAVSENAQAILISLGDMPLVNASDLNRLISAFEDAHGATIALPVFKGRPGNPVIFNVCHKDEMLKLRGDVGCKSILSCHPQQVLEVEMENAHILCDVDTVEAYEVLSQSNSE
jgi:molybdenum cofactor cytidylyltransferase